MEEQNPHSYVQKCSQQNGCETSQVGMIQVSCFLYKNYVLDGNTVRISKTKDYNIRRYPLDWINPEYQSLILALAELYNTFLHNSHDLHWTCNQRGSPHGQYGQEE